MNLWDRLDPTEKQAVEQFAVVLMADRHATEIVVRFEDAADGPRWFIDGEDVTP